MGDVAQGVDLGNGPDLLDPAGWMRLVGDTRPEVIYHLAGWSDVGRSWNEPVTTWRVNTEGVLAVLEAARAHDVGRVIVISSADVYGIVRPDQLPLTEDTPTEPRSPYGASKVGAGPVWAWTWAQARPPAKPSAKARPEKQGRGRGRRFTPPTLSSRSSLKGGKWWLSHALIAP